MKNQPAELTYHPETIERLTAGLNQQQLEAVVATEGPVLTIAGAGSGKTRVLTRRIARRITLGETDPRRVLAVTFTNKAAQELKQRMWHLGLRDQITAGTFHGIALRQLKQRWEEKKVSPPTLLSSKHAFLLKHLPKNLKKHASIAAGEIGWASARMISTEHYPALAKANNRHVPVSYKEIAEIMHMYASKKQRKKMIDFEDLLLFAIEDLRQDPTYAAAVRWRHRHFYIDEFQDINPLQFELLQQWRSARPDLFIVGDPNQAIYGWNGADSNLLNDFLEIEPSTKVINLAFNYRSTPEIIRVAESCLPTRNGKLPGNYRNRLQPQNPHGVAPMVTSHQDEEEEALAIAKKIKRFDTTYADHAILVRTQNQMKVLKETLTKERIPYHIQQEKSLSDAPEIQQEMEMLTSPTVFFEKALETLTTKVNTFSTAPETKITYTHLQTLLEMANQYAESAPRRSGSGFKQWLEGNESSGETYFSTDAVTLLTFHACKGLEWPIVHIAGMEEGYVPIKYAETPSQLDEENRLLYVASTRAEQELHYYWAQNRQFGETSVARNPAPQIKGIEKSIEKIKKKPLQKADWQTYLNGTRSLIPHEEEAALLYKKNISKLLLWRKAKAKAVLVSPQAIIKDHTIEKIAQKNPRSLSDLASLEMYPRKITKFGKEIINCLER